jgi:hypothetical protein
MKMKTIFHRVVRAVLCILVGFAFPARLAQGQSISLTNGILNVKLASYYDYQPISVTSTAAVCSVPFQLSQVPNASNVCSSLGLDDNTKNAIERNGFAVVPWGSEDSMVTPYVSMTNLSVPNFVTSDSLLHLYHVQFDEILKCVETNIFFPDLITMSRALFDQSTNQYASFSGDLKEAARRNAGYFSVVLKVLGEEVDVPAYVSGAVSNELVKIEDHAGFGTSDLFVYEEDYSQYVPRGHYTRSETLKKFFKVMMWYGRMSFLLKGSQPWGPACDALISVQDAKIQTIQASLMTLGLDSLRANDKPIADTWNRMYAVTAFFVGLADDLTPYEYKDAILKVFGSTVAPLNFNDDAKMFSLKTELALLRSPEIYGGTGKCEINTYPPTPEDLDKVLAKTKGMRFMGQRFIPDSYMFQNLVYPAVGAYVGTNAPFTRVDTIMGPMRGFPRGLDVMAVLGSERALAILDHEGDTDYIGYDSTMNDLIVQFRSFSRDDWNRNLYWSWLYSLQPLLSACGPEYPAFMQTRAWQDKQLNTALASWTELRHDTILYAKQSYTPGPTSIPPGEPPPPPDRGFVEPVPEFYNRLLALTRMTRTGLKVMDVLDSTQENRLLSFEIILSRLKDISVAELAGTQLSEDDYNYIKLFSGVLAPLVTGLSDAEAARTTLVGDVHTDGNTYQVLEEGVGYVNLMVAAYWIPEGRLVLGAGPVFSYYEFKWPMSDRLTDEAWTNMLVNDTQPARPDWVSSFVKPVTLSPDNGSTNLYPRMLNPQLKPSGFNIGWCAGDGKRYRAFYADDLAGGWYLLQTPVTSAGSSAELTDTNAVSRNHRFYKVIQVP